MKARKIVLTLCIIMLSQVMLHMSVYGETATAIDVNDFESKMAVGGTQTLNVELYPKDAEDTIKYDSSNPEVASISLNGKIEAKAAGKTNITVTAGNVSKKINLTVIVETKEISLNSTYIVLKEGEQFKLVPSITPSDANQKVKYKSSDKSVAKVNDKGVITAIGTGSASIIVSNSDLSVSADVIVNNDNVGGYALIFSYDDTKNESKRESEISGMEKSSAGNGKLTKEVLRKLQKSGNSFTVEKQKYDIVINGVDIVNSDNELDDKLYITESNDGYTISVGNSGKFLPGNILIRFKDEHMKKCRYVYLLDEKNDGYRMFGELTDGSYTTDIAGTYHITYDKMQEPNEYVSMALIAAAILSFGFIIYLLLRRILL